ncbi:uncharacterized protein LY89DRAFT_779225 [Mollisia scopiformis]|uniref:Zn(2)-C6 fungal-type domain-containing protein n=1 Tax=Mollisia scopiformis TaxID=149040 RepID=A0A194XL12_MOLSC|nr:uncharacterized protein LY89DRAFT_779225 [Mollisia scopiformis]KUJ20462.1 hypothetical protein LY89DRAFT_779225 [Mollisia scopiformis]
MVFCGKPSKGCAHCRTRRIKCDLLQPACSQCLRAGKECPGYRDQLALMFRDENEKVVTKATIPKAKAEPRKRPRGPSPGSRSESASPPSLSPGQVVFQHRIFPPTTLQDEGIRFFFCNYVNTGMENFKTRADAAETAMFQLLFRSESFSNAVSSVGYAGLSNVSKDPQHMLVARRKYAASIQNIARALEDVANSDLDATLKSVMLLAAFEIVNGTSRSIGVGSSWAVHIEGGAEILKMLAIKEPELLPRRRGWIQFVFAVYIKSLSKGEEAPSTMHDWCESCGKSMSSEDAPAISLAHIAYRFTNLHASIRNKTLLDSNLILLEALTLDSELEAWQKALPAKWRFTTTPAPDNMHFTFRGQKHTYEDMWVSRVLNNYRWVRILVNELLLVHMAQLGSFASEYESQRERSLEIISRMASDICICVSGTFFRTTPVPGARWTIPAMSGIFMVLFPLAVAGSAWGVSEELHCWVISVLEFIGNRMGISQATAMLDLIRLHRRAFEEDSDEFHTISDLWIADALSPSPRF